MRCGARPNGKFSRKERNQSKMGQYIRIDHVVGRHVGGVVALGNTPSLPGIMAISTGHRINPRPPAGGDNHHLGGKRTRVHFTQSRFRGAGGAEGKRDQVEAKEVYLPDTVNRSATPSASFQCCVGPRAPYQLRQGMGTCFLSRACRVRPGEPGRGGFEPNAPF